VVRYATQTENNNVTFSGGDPLSFEFSNTLEIAKVLKEQYNKNIWVYSGFTWEQIIHSNRLSKILPYIDVLVDGRFEIDKLDLSLAFRGSSNQRIINVPLSLQENKTILWKEED
jgi:anaerobic ribonucleoside-triphosphate reductase activating protein